MKRTAAYYRSSTNIQEESVNSQRYNTNQYALKKGILIDIEYPEPFVSARKNKLNERPQMRQLMTDIRNGKIGKLLVYKRDRLARRIQDHLELHRLFKKYEVEVLFIAENEPPMRFDIFGEITELFIGVMNQREGEQINERILDTKITNFKQGLLIGHLPYGYSSNKEETKIIREEEELKVVQYIFREWNTDQYKSMQKLADQMKKEGYKRMKKNKKGIFEEQNWDTNNIRDVLTNPIYSGIRVATFGDTQIEKIVEKLKVIEPEDFQLAQKLIEKRSRVTNEKQRFEYLLSGLLFCEMCEREKKNEQVDKDKKQEKKKEHLDEDENKLNESEQVDKNENMEKAKSSEPLVNYERMKDGQLYATYECKKHNIKLPVNEIENLIYIKTRDFFEQLLKSNFNDMFTRQKQKFFKELKRLKNEYEKSLKQAEEKLVNATNKWIKHSHQANKERVLISSREVKDIKEKIYKLDEKHEKIRAVPELNEELKDEILKKEIWDALPSKRKEMLIRDLIQTILVDGDTLNIIFKHPYLEANGVTV